MRREKHRRMQGALVSTVAALLLESEVQVPSLLPDWDKLELIDLAWEGGGEGPRLQHDQSRRESCAPTMARHTKLHQPCGTATVDSSYLL